MLKRLILKLIIIIILIAVATFAIRYADKAKRYFADTTTYDQTISRISEKYSIDPLFVKAVIWRESGFNPQSRGTAGEIGLMQIMPQSATIASPVTDWERAHKRKIQSEGSLFFPETNIDIGAWYLAKALGYYRGYKYQKELALCVYNRGKRTTNGWMKGLGKDDPIIDNIGSKMTKKYVKTIMEKYNSYKAEKK